MSCIQSTLGVCWDALGRFVFFVVLSLPKRCFELGTLNIANVSFWFPHTCRSVRTTQRLSLWGRSLVLTHPVFPRSPDLRCDFAVRFCLATCFHWASFRRPFSGVEGRQLAAVDGSGLQETVIKRKEKGSHPRVSSAAEKLHSGTEESSSGRLLWGSLEVVSHGFARRISQQPVHGLLEKLRFEVGGFKMVRAERNQHKSCLLEGSISFCDINYPTVCLFPVSRFAETATSPRAPSSDTILHLCPLK